ncbi:hypothetical protein CLOM_g20049 [Closterium sp. NIES-68]|nr:hypothetical protein CLOM_g20049 [Closterium sp. NIES-68]GJP73924.1 hypothetical protein CLOP_g4590 [Closterium sp. NIES-67]
MDERTTFLDEEWASLLQDSSTAPLADIDISAFANLPTDILEGFRDETGIATDGTALDGAAIDGAAVDVELGERPLNKLFPLNTDDVLFCDEGGSIHTAGGPQLLDTPPSGRSSPEPLVSINHLGLPYLVQGGSHGADGSSDGDCGSGDYRSGDCAIGGCKEGSSNTGSPWHQSSAMSAHPCAAAPLYAATPPMATGGGLNTGGSLTGIPPPQLPESMVKQETVFAQQQQLASQLAMQSARAQALPFPVSVSSCYQQQQQPQQQQQQPQQQLQYRLQKQQQRRQQRQQKQLQKQQQQQQKQQLDTALSGCHLTPCTGQNLPSTLPGSFQFQAAQDAATCTAANVGFFPENASVGAENVQKECESGGAEARGSVAGGGSGAAAAAEDAGSEPSEGDGDEGGEGRDAETEKREARLIRNRESAQLSRQRKKYYMDELEAQIRTMSAAVAELNSAVAHLTAENVSLRRQLAFFYSSPAAASAAAAAAAAGTGAQEGAQEGEQEEAGETTREGGSSRGPSGGCAGSRHANSSSTGSSRHGDTGGYSKGPARHSNIAMSRHSGSSGPTATTAVTSSSSSSSSSSRITEEASQGSPPPVPVPVLSRRTFLRRRYLREVPTSKQAIPLPDANQAIPLMPPAQDTVSSATNQNVIRSGEGRNEGGSGEASTVSVDVSGSLEHNSTAHLTSTRTRSVAAAAAGRAAAGAAGPAGSAGSAGSGAGAGARGGGSVGLRLPLPGQQGGLEKSAPVVVSILSGVDASSLGAFVQSGTPRGFAGADGVGGSSERVGKGGAEEELRQGMAGSVVVMVTSGGKSVAYACALHASQGSSKVGGLVQARSG